MLRAWNKINDILIRKGFLVYLLLALFILFHLYLISKTFVFDDAGNIRTSYSAYGDIPFHMTQISKFGYGSLFDFNEPLFSGETIKYSFIINYFSGMLLKFTDSWTFSMHVPSMIFITASYLLLFIIYNKILNKRLAALIAVVIFFFGSGMGGYGLIRDKLIGESMAPASFVSYLTDNNIFTFTKHNASYPQQNIAWASPLSLSFLHQRSFFLGLLLFSIFLYLILFKIKNSDRKTPLFIAGLAFGLGPLGHYHTFVIMGIVAGFYLMRSLMEEDFILAKKIFIIGMIAGIIALPQVIYLLSGNGPEVIYGDNSIIKFRVGWMADAGFGSVQYPIGEIGILSKFVIYLKFLWINFGLILPLFIAGILIRPIRSSITNFLWLAGIIFTVNQLFKFQPWDYDNNKLLVYFGFFTAPVIASIMIYVSKKLKWLGVIASSVILFFVIFSGVIDTIPRYKVEIEKMPIIFNVDARNTSYFIRQNISPNDMILATTTHLNLVSSLAGRPTVVGFPGWLWTKGIDYSSRELDLKSFYLNPIINLGIADKYMARYVLIDPTAIYDWGVDKKIFDDNFKKLFSSGGYDLYDLE